MQFENIVKGYGITVALFGLLFFGLCWMFFARNSMVMFACVLTLSLVLIGLGLRIWKYPTRTVDWWAATPSRKSWAFVVTSLFVYLLTILFFLIVECYVCIGSWIVLIAITLVLVFVIAHMFFTSYARESFKVSLTKRDEQ